MYKLIADYTTISVSGSGSTAQKVSSLASQAKRLTNDGWTTLGSITADSEGVLYQVMLKYAPPDKPSPTANDR